MKDGQGKDIAVVLLTRGIVYETFLLFRGCQLK
jgi:hypothetical protein